MGIVFYDFFYFILISHFFGFKYGRVLDIYKYPNYFRCGLILERCIL